MLMAALPACRDGIADRMGLEERCDISGAQKKLKCICGIATQSKGVCFRVEKALGPTVAGLEPSTQHSTERRASFAVIATAPLEVFRNLGRRACKPGHYHMLRCPSGRQVAGAENG